MEDESISIDELRLGIDTKFQVLCNAAKIGGAATLDELADVVSDMCLMIKFIDCLMSAVLKLQDEVSALKRK
jgi:hypothetical protein